MATDNPAGEAALRYMLGQVPALVQQAKANGYDRFSCWVDLRDRNLPIVLRFSNGTHHYIKTLRWYGFYNELRLVATLDDATYLMRQVQSDILTADGIAAERFAGKRVPVPRQ